MMNWPPARSEAPVRAIFKAAPEDFIVHEKLSFDPIGEGEHCLVQLRKTCLTTPELARLLADAHGLDLVDVGYAGMKDKQAVTSQWFSLRGVTDLDETILELAEVELLAQTRHSQKLRKGQLSGNEFQVRLKGVSPDSPEQALRQLASAGAPNYVGSQRFGWDNIERATQWLPRRRRSRLSKFKQGLYLSVLRSLLFNEVLAARVRAGNWHTAIDGDRLWDGLPTGPLWGRGRSDVHGEAARIEAAALEPHAAILEGLEYAGLKQDRRPLVLRPGALRWQRDGSDLILNFNLGPGQYATSLLGEVFELVGSPGTSGVIRGG